MVNEDDVALVRKELEATVNPKNKNMRSEGEQAFNRMMQEVLSNQHELRRLRKLKAAMDTIGKMFRGWDY